MNPLFPWNSPPFCVPYHLFNHFMCHSMEWIWRFKILLWHYSLITLFFLLYSWLSMSNLMKSSCIDMLHIKLHLLSYSFSYNYFFNLIWNYRTIRGNLLFYLKLQKFLLLSIPSILKLYVFALIYFNLFSCKSLYN